VSEDTFYVDKNGKLQDFIADLPHTPEDIEALMHGKAANSVTPAAH
jgi:Xaa-Pro aminopeptidase